MMDKDELLKFLDTRIQKSRDYQQKYMNSLRYFEGCEAAFQFIKNVLIGEETVDDLKVNDDR